jgi:hypothetical protein
MADQKRSELADTLAEAGRKLGQAISDALDRMRPAIEALEGMANRPEVRAMRERAEKLAQHRPCLCFCARAHPEDRGICEMFDAVITGQHRSEFLGEVDIPLCAPCAAARAARHFARRSA